VTYRWLMALAMTGLMLLPAKAQSGESASFESAGGAAGLGFLRPDQWGLIRSRIRNSGDQPTELLAAVQFKDSDNIQFVTRTWVPPQSVREILQPVYLHTAPRSDRAVDIASILIDTARSEQMRGREDGLIRLDMDEHAMAMVGSMEGDDAISAVIASRLSSNLGKRLAYVNAGQLPALPAAYSAIRTLVLADPKIALTPERVHAIRSWLSAGGRLWLVLDQLPDDLGPTLIGNDWPIAVIDRLPITDLTLLGPRSSLQRQRDKPWDMVRVVAPGTRVLHTVDGWPASLTFGVGKGMVIVTTLDGAAWWTESKQPGGEAEATEPLAELGSVVYAAQPAAPIDAQRFGSFVREQIGYQILGRTPVLLVLAALPAAVILSGLWLARRQQLERVGVIAAAGAVVLCAVLIAMGAAQRRTVPLTVASAQWVQVAPGQNMAAVEAAISIYSPEADRGPLSGKAGGVLWPDMTGQAGRRLRMVWTDLDNWSWEGLELPSGAVRTAEATHVLTFDRRVNVTLTFGPRGIEGQLTPGPFEQLEDLVLATPVAAMAVRPDADGSFVVQPADQLPRGDYIAGVTLSQQQRARQDVYRSLLAGTSYPAEPTLLAWAMSLELGLELSIEAQQHHTALVAFPVELTPVMPGQRVSLPAAFVPFTVVRGASNEGTTTLYSPTTREWIDTAQGATLLLRFQLPRQVLPLRIEGATLTFDLTARDRVIEVLRVADQQITPVARFDGASGPQRVTLRADALGPLDGDGGLIVGLRIHDTQDFSTSSVWRMIDARLDVEGVVLTPQ
jgi:hypothetical protein